MGNTTPPKCNTYLYRPDLTGVPGLMKTIIHHMKQWTKPPALLEIRRGDLVPEDCTEIYIGKPGTRNHHLIVPVEHGDDVQPGHVLVYIKKPE